MVVAAVLWSTSGLFIKILSIDAFSFTALRSAVAAVTLFALARLLKIRIGYPKTLLAWGAVVAYAFILILFVAATKKTTAANAIFLQYTAPIYVLMLEPLLLKTRFRARDLVFVALAIAGMALFFVGRIEVGDMTGNLLALASGVFFGLFSVALRAEKGDDGARWQAVTWGNVVLAGAIGVYFLVSPASVELPATNAEWLGLVFCGVIQIGVAYALFAVAIAKLSALEAMLLGMLEPILNPIWVFFGTGERPSWLALVGACVIVCSVVARSVVAQGDEREAEA